MTKRAVICQNAWQQSSVSRFLWNDYCGTVETKIRTVCAMKRSLLRTFLCVAAVVAVWLFIGIERLVGDHEIGVSYQPFIKHRPDWRLLFSDPTQVDLETISFKKLTAAGQRSVIEYCEIRFGLINVEECYLRVAGRKI